MTMRGLILGMALICTTAGFAQVGTVKKPIEPTTQLVAFPNPTLGMSRVIVLGPSEWDLNSFEVFNLAGQKIDVDLTMDYSSTLNNAVILNMTDYPSGMYLVNFTHEQKTFQTKLIRQ